MHRQAGLWRSSFLWHWCLPAFGAERRRRRRRCRYTCRCVKRASRYRKAQISARHRARRKKNRAESLFAKEVGALLFFFCVLFPRLTSPSRLSVFTLMRWNKPTSSAPQLRIRPNRGFFFFNLEHDSLPQCVSGLEHLVSKVNEYSLSLPEQLLHDH